MRKHIAFWLSIAIAMLAGLAPAVSAQVTLSGEVTYRERMALPPGASLRVRLIDLTAPGTPTRLEAEADIAAQGQVPLTFTLNFDDSAIESGHQHAIVAEISADDTLWFRNSEPYRVNPLAPEAPVMIVANFVGRLSPAPEPEAAAVPATPSILDVTWRAEAIKGEPVGGEADSTLSITSDMRAGGLGGCNNYFTQAEIDGESLRFSAVASTRMACLSEAVSAQETAFFAALGEVRSWRVTGETLILLDAGNDEVLRFQRSTL